jgi:biopolymer transport protein ExbB/TolQ
MRGIVAGGILMTGPYWGLLGVFLGMQQSRAVIENLKAPTPADLARGVELSLYASYAGMAACVIGTVLVVWSALALARKREPTAEFEQ